MQKIVDLLKKLNASPDLTKEITEGLEAYKASIKAQYESEFKERTAAARKVCIEAVENEKKEKALICRELDFGEPPEPPRIMSLADKAKKFEDPKVKRLWEQVIEDIPKEQIEVKPVSGYTVTLWYKGKRFMWMRPRRKWFSVDILSPAGGWGGLANVSTRKDWDKILAGRMKKYLAHIDATVEE